jgi:hypothetical protein
MGLLLILAAIVTAAMAQAEEPWREELGQAHQQPLPESAPAIVSSDCTLQTPYQSGPFYDLGSNDNTSQSDMLFCNLTGSIESVVFNTHKGNGESALDKLWGDWSVYLAGNLVFPRDEFDIVNSPEEDGPAADYFSWQPPLDGKLYDLCLVSAVWQLPGNTGGEPKTTCQSFHALLGEILILSRTDKSEPIPEARYTLKKDGVDQGTFTTDKAGNVTISDLVGGVYQVVQDNSSLPPGSEPIDPVSGSFQVTLTPENRLAELTFVNFVPDNSFLPVINNDICGREIRVSYLGQTDVYGFEPVAYPAEEIGTLPYGTRVSFEALDGLPWGQIVIESVIEGQPVHYDYRDEKGPVVVYYGTWPQDEDSSPNEFRIAPGVDHTIVIDYPSGETRCVFAASVQWDPE